MRSYPRTLSSSPNWLTRQKGMPAPVKWYFCLSEASITRPEHAWRDLVRVAVLSALRNTRLKPYMLYDGEENAFTAELRGMGVTIIRHRVSFHAQLATRKEPGYLAIAEGSFLRVEIPLIETEDDYILYTDCDVAFRSDPQITALPALFAAAPETSRSDYKGNMNAGVMLMHVPALRADLRKFTGFICKHLHDGWPGCDQENYRRFYAGKWDALDVVHNWKPYWGANPKATIVHWHGPKPTLVRKLLRSPGMPVPADWRRLFDQSPGGYRGWLQEWDDLAAATCRAVIGCLDRLDASGGAGWALYEDDRSHPVTLEIELDGVPLATTECAIPRPDLAALTKSGIGGFRFPLPKSALSPGEHTIRLKGRNGAPCALGWQSRQTSEFHLHLSEAEAPPDATPPAAAATAPAVAAEEDVVVCIDEIGPQGLRGWAMDRANPSMPVVIRLIIDGAEVASFACAGSRPDVVSAGIPENVGFAQALDRALFDDKPHLLELRSASGRPAAIVRAGETCAAITLKQKWCPRVLSHIDGVRDGVIKGWVLTEDPASGRRTGGAQLLVSCEGVPIAQIRATAFRPDVAKHHAGPADCGFEFIPPPAFRRARPQSFGFHLLPYEMELDGSPCVTSFIGDEQQTALLTISEEIDSLYRQITGLRRRMRLLVPRPTFKLDDYDSWVKDYLAALRGSVAALRYADARTRARARPAEPLVSIVCPTYRPDLGHFVQAVESVVAQTFRNWELVIVDDGSQMPALSAEIAAMAARDPRIRPIVRDRNGGIGAATNAGIKAARGAWVALLDHDDLLVDVALEVMVAAAAATGAKVVYSDEDKIDTDGRLSEPAFKPDWNHRLLLSVNYVCHLLMVDRAVLRRAGPLHRKYEGAQDHALLLRLAELVPPEQIHHVPEVLYHWRKSATSTAASTGAKEYAIEAGIAAVTDHLARTGRRAKVTAIGANTWYRVRWTTTAAPSITIIIPFKDAVDTTRECVRRIREGTDYTNYELILIDNWSISAEAEAFCADMRALPGCRVLRVEEEFNYSRLNNLAADYAMSDFLVLMNNDLFVTDRAWLRTMVNEALADDRVAIVGGKYLYPNGTVQHGGVVLGIGGVASHVHTGLPADDPGYAARALFAQEMSAVTAACLLIRAEVYRQVGGLDEEELRIAFNDVDLCLKARAAGWKIVWTPEVVAEHHESLSRGDDQQQAHKEARFFDEWQVMINRWGDTLRRDPFYSKHFSLDGRPFFDLVAPQAPKRAGLDRAHISVAAQ